MQKRGLSEVVVSIMLIILVLVAISIVWVFIREMLQKSSEEITITQFTNNLKINDAKIGLLTANVKLTRTEGNAELTSLKFIFNNGEYVYEQKSYLPKALETKTYEIPLRNTTKLKEISVIPVFDKTLGLETKREITNQDFNYTLERNNGLVAYYKFDDGTAGDSSGNNKDGINNGATLVNGKIGKAMSFINSEGDYIKIDNFKLGTEGTISVIVNPSSIRVGHIFWSGVFSGDGFGDEKEIHLSQNNVMGNGIFSIFINGLTNPVSQFDYCRIESNLKYQPGTWYNIVVTYKYTLNNISCEMYINGDIDGTNSTITGIIDTSVFLPYSYIGRSQGLTGLRYFDGIIDEVMIFNRSLSDAEVQQIYLSQK